MEADDREIGAECRIWEILQGPRLLMGSVLLNNREKLHFVCNCYLFHNPGFCMRCCWFSPSTEYVDIEVCRDCFNWKSLGDVRNRSDDGYMRVERQCE